uniref:Reverse transcriptase Ty1/copia-type domain-containing protein n=1 Tax=Cajanus cajan TaxID=3821 RepID=A0A151TSS3_CAJCA|nr:hypothetical protein KK1_009246 [Cajanus cajan]
MSMMGELKFFLGLQIVQSEEGIKIHQKKYTKELLQKFKIADAKPMKTPMHPSTTLGLDEESPYVDSTMYQGMVGSLLYLTMSRPDIMFNVYICARFQVRPKEVHLQAVKRILRYLKGTPNLGFNFYRSQNFSLLGYCDADYVRDKWERKSTSGGSHFLDRCLVSWTSKRQSTISLTPVKLSTVKRILRYLKGTPNLGFNFYRSQNFSLLGYCDADYVRDKWERKSTSGGSHFLDRCLVSWTSKRQSTISLTPVKLSMLPQGSVLRNYFGNTYKNLYPRILCPGVTIP